MKIRSKIKINFRMRNSENNKLNDDKNIAKSAQEDQNQGSKAENQSTRNKN